MFLGAPSAVVWAHHSASSPPTRWDLDNDGVWEATDSIVSYSQGGGAWTAEKIQRVSEGVQKWATQTDWNPWFSSNPVSRKIYVDGTSPHQAGEVGDCDVTWAEAGQPYALNCVTSVLKNGGAWFRITDSDIYLNSGDNNFDWGATANNNPSGRGVVAHETGHGANLIDVGWFDCDPFGELITMCGSMGNSQTWGAYSLTNDDINSANDMYPP